MTDEETPEGPRVTWSDAARLASLVVTPAVLCTVWIVSSISRVGPDVLREVDRLYVRKDISEQRWNTFERIVRDLADEVRALRKEFPK